MSIEPDQKIDLILEEFNRSMLALHPRIDPTEHLVVLENTGDLTLDGSNTTISQVTEKLRSLGCPLSDGQIRSRIYDLEKGAYTTMKYEYETGKLINTHKEKGILRYWKQLIELLEELNLYFEENTTVKVLVDAEMEDLERMRIQKDFFGFIEKYNSIIEKVTRVDKICNLYPIETKGEAKRIELTSSGWFVYNNSHLV